MNNPYYYQMPSYQYARPQQPAWTPPQLSQPQQEEKIYVQGMDAAKAYLVTANSSVRLWDSTQPIFYEKWADASGRPSLTAYRYEAVDLTERPLNGNTNISDYENRLNGIEARLKRLEGGLNDEQSNADA